jgi:hypothetical protein
MTTRTRTTKNAKPAAGTLEWLTAVTRKGLPRIQTLSWGRLGQIYRSKQATPAVRRAIEREARACGYRPQSVMSLNAWN